ncbi:carboxylating nicotinate-nucleotide diphosphorylase [Methylomonas sp. EFPC3]|uniref:carboxylating nicotinate-nucleotide diphosphorylase n=1 Tax=Methylomonas sp. EFPC3 TaxID=3021710 RepID=UPI0024170EDB|nr:carboxylating nicotinate-nucleotide diphosphorylase [Methylomonas sp. EFPC3]WFP49093.1 carboxylating nicotinate-nucleotide diphosphorylase [Methylomonas sp. EFPC3]
MQPDPAEIDRFLAEDIGDGDLTANIIPEAIQASATVVTRENMVLCGSAWFDAVFERLSPQLMIEWVVSDGDWVAADTVLCRLSGPARALLTGERTALNLLQTLSATASVAREYANAVAGTGCKVLDTRKTLPGLRLAQKYAVQCGGCFNHRIGLFDAILIKENHILAAGSIAEAVREARSQASVPVEVEVENLDELEQALAARPDRVMLDNFSVAELVAAVSRNQGQVELEASGNITLQNIRSVAETGVDFISIGALTKNIKAVDLSMRIDMRIG